MPLDMETKRALDDSHDALNGHLKELKSSQAAMSEKLKVLEEKSNNGEDITDITTRLEEERETMTKMGDAITELQKKSARLDRESKSVSQQIAESKDFLPNLRSGKRMEFKDITTASGGAGFTINTLTRTLDRGMAPPINQRLYLRDLLPTITTNAGSFIYRQEASFTNNAAVVEEGDAKPKSDVTFEPKQGNIKKLAHFFQVTEEALDDVDMMEGYIRERGLYGLRLVEEQQLLTGNDSATQLDGLLNTGNFTAYSNATVPGFTPAAGAKMDDLRVAIAQIEDADLMPSAIVMNHLDVAGLQLEKDGDGKYLHPAFTGSTAWGLPLVSTKGFAQGSFMVGALQGNVLVHQRKGIEVRRSTENEDNFITNEVTILLEERLGLEVRYPTGIVSGAFTTS
ncbi:MAG: phage major capsid protein [Pseudomonadota bacterium]